MIVSEVVQYFLYGVGVAVPLVLTFYDVIGFPSTVTGRSMRPTFNPEGSHDNDKVWLSTQCRNNGRYGVGDVVALYSPVDPSKRMIKRIIAIEGEMIQSKGYQRRCIVIPPGHCWVEGDNTNISQDSNFYGPISLGLVIGRVLMILWPLSRCGHVPQSLTSHQESRRLD